MSNKYTDDTSCPVCGDEFDDGYCHTCGEDIYSNPWFFINHQGERIDEEA